jgi:hypothetical protein
MYGSMMVVEESGTTKGQQAKAENYIIEFNLI